MEKMVKNKTAEYMKSRILHNVSINYKIPVAVAEDESVESVCNKTLDSIIKNEKPSICDHGPVITIESWHNWYNKFPYTTNFCPQYCQYYTMEEIRKRKDVVGMVKNILTEAEWKSLKSLIRADYNE